MKDGCEGKGPSTNGCAITNARMANAGGDAMFPPIWGGAAGKGDGLGYPGLDWEAGYE